MADTIEVAVGGHTAQASLDVIIAGGLPTLTGDVSGTITTDHELVGVVSLTGDFIVDGATLVARSGVVVEGNGHEIMFMNGGRADFQGTPKSGWVVWGDPVDNWTVGDRLAVAPLAVGDWSVKDSVWTGDWNDVQPSTDTLTNGRVVAAEVANLDRGIIINNVARIMFHMGAGVSILRYVAVTNSGVEGELGFYPVHFHLNVDTVRGSLVEGVVVENSANRAFVPHGSHGIIMRDCAAVHVIDEAYWWDKPSEGDQTNNSDDIVWEDCLALGVYEGDNRNRRLAGFSLGAGVGNAAVGCHVAGVRNQTDTASAFIWPEFVGGGENNDGVWEFRHCVGHNNEQSGIFVWQNDGQIHRIEDTLLYRNGENGIYHGAYRNSYQYERVQSLDNEANDGRVHAVSRDLPNEPNRFIDVETTGNWLIAEHARNPQAASEYINVDFASVSLWEPDEPSILHFFDSGLTPADFDTGSGSPDTIIRIFEGGVLQHEWVNGVWT